MKFSIILPTFLGNYKNAATNRDMKLRRAIESVLDQTCQDFELNIICDGCEKSYAIVEQIAMENPAADINCWMIPKQQLWSGTVRNMGIKHSKGTYISYIDGDDVWGPDHLKVLDQQSDVYQDKQWLWFNDFIFKGGRWVERDCNLNVKGANGTSNIIHKRMLNVYWIDGGYEHDWKFIQRLMLFPNYQQIETPDYRVCHIPNHYDI